MSKGTIFILMFVVGMFIIVPIFITPISAAPVDWKIETVDSEMEVGLGASLALDGKGSPHISYLDTSSYDLKYATWAGSKWKIETVDSEGDIGLSTSLALDGDGNPHISYLETSSYDLKYATFNGSAWEKQIVDSEGYVGLCSSIALDGNGYPQISYIDSINGYLKYAKLTDSGWDIQIVDPNNVGRQASLVLDGNGNPHISYYNGYLKYTTRTGSKWDPEIVDPKEGIGWMSSLALDANGTPQISYIDGPLISLAENTTNGSLKYAKLTGSGFNKNWDIRTVDGTGDIGGGISLALDVNGNPQISYYELTNGNLKYATWTGSGFDTQIVDSVGKFGGYSSLALDVNGRPHISYYDSNNGDLKYAYLNVTSRGLDLPLWAELIAGVLAITFPVAAIVWWQKKKKQNPLSGILPPGWQFYAKPTTGEPPGTIFRLSPDKRKFWVKQLDVKISPSEESGGKYTRKATMDILLRFNGFKKISATGKARKVQHLVFEMKDPTGEATYDADLDPKLVKWFESSKFQIREGDRYFVIRDATKTKAINYHLTQEQVEVLKENASLDRNILKQSVGLSSQDRQEFVLPQEFNEPMRIMFNAEEIKMKLVQGKIKLSHHPVKGVLEWTE